jgi:hypothetical protein
VFRKRFLKNHVAPMLLLSFALVGVPHVGSATNVDCHDAAVNNGSCSKSGHLWSVFTSLQTGAGAMFLFGGVSDAHSSGTWSATSRVQIRSMDVMCNGAWSQVVGARPIRSLDDIVSATVSCSGGTQPTQAYGRYAYGL